MVARADFFAGCGDDKEGEEAAEEEPQEEGEDCRVYCLGNHGRHVSKNHFPASCRKPGSSKKFVIFVSLVWFVVMLILECARAFYWRSGHWRTWKMKMTRMK
jgi:hypothetical protein